MDSSNSVALVRRGKKRRKAAAAAAKAAKENEAAAAAAAKAAETNEAKSTESAGDKPTEKDEAGTGTEKDEVANESNAKPSQEVPDTPPKHSIASQRHSRMQAAINLGKKVAGHPLTHEVARGALRLAVAHVFGM